MFLPCPLTLTRRTCPHSLPGRLIPCGAGDSTSCSCTWYCGVVCSCGDDWLGSAELAGRHAPTHMQPGRRPEMLLRCGRLLMQGAVVSVEKAASNSLSLSAWWTGRCSVDESSNDEAVRCQRLTGRRSINQSIFDELHRCKVNDLRPVTPIRSERASKLKSRRRRNAPGLHMQPHVAQRPGPVVRRMRCNVVAIP